MEIEIPYRSLAESISSDFQTPSSHIQLSPPSTQPYSVTVNCSSNSTNNHNGVLVNSHTDLSRNQSFSPPNPLYPPTIAVPGSTLMSCARQSQMSSPLESKPVIGITSDGNPCSVDSLSQSSTPAIMSLAIGNENDYNTESSAIATVDESVSTCKTASATAAAAAGSGNFAWIKEKKSTRKQHQG